MEFYVLYPKRIMYIRSRGVGSIHEQIGRKKNRVTLHAFIQDFKLKSLISFAAFLQLSFVLKLLISCIFS